MLLPPVSDLRHFLMLFFDMSISLAIDFMLITPSRRVSFATPKDCTTETTVLAWTVRRSHPLVRDIINNIASPGYRKIKYTDRQIFKILMLLQIFGISYRLSNIFFTNHVEYI